MSSDGTHDKWGNNLPPGDMGKFPPPLRDVRKGPMNLPQRHPGVPTGPAEPKRSRVRGPSTPKAKPKSAADKIMDEGMGKGKKPSGGGSGGKAPKKSSSNNCLVLAVAMMGTAAYLVAGAYEAIRWMVA